MKTNKNLFIFGGIFIFSVLFLFGGANETLPLKLKATPELKKKFPIKVHHEKLLLDCTFCHEGQGDNPKKYKTPGDEGCLSCHKTKELLAKRLEFMDVLDVNPHNSIHDGPNLYCDECHNEHKESTNMCAECHEHDIKIWMKETP